MSEEVTSHYSGGSGFAEKIAESLRRAGKDISSLTTADLASVDEFHFREGRATLELAAHMNLNENSSVLDIGSGLGGPARTLAEAYGCHVTGLDLTQAFCDVAECLSDWVNLSQRTAFQQGDATNPRFADNQFDAAMTIHAAMNIPAKDRVYEQARRVVKPGGIFAVYDVLQGEGGAVLFPAPWAPEPSISHLVTPEDLAELLSDAGFKILDVRDSTEESRSWLEALMAPRSESVTLPALAQVLFGDDVSEMAINQLRNLEERRIRTVSYICQA